MKHKIGEGLKVLCKEVLDVNKTSVEWSEIESSDMFQNDVYNGGYDATEDEFCFSVYLDDNEYWFQFSFEDVFKIVSGELNTVDVRKADI